MVRTTNKKIFSTVMASLLTFVVLGGILLPISVSAQEPSSSEIRTISGTPVFYNQTVKLAEKYGIKSGKELQALQGLKIAAKSYSEGDKEEFWCADNWYAQDGIDNDGDGKIDLDDPDEFMYEITATCKKVGTHCYIFAEDGQIMFANFDHVMNEFDDAIYPTDTDTFGSEPNVDGDTKIFILLLNIRDRNYHDPLYLYAVAGYFQAYQESTEPYSNHKDMIYMDVCFPVCLPLACNIDSTIAHEFQHMIHWNHDANELIWVDEGCSVYAEYICGYGQPTDKINAFKKLPDTQLNDWGGEGDELLAHYGASYLWTLYLSEKCGDLSGQSGKEHFIRDLVEEDDNGIPGINDVLEGYGYTQRFVNIFKNWVIANYLDSATIKSEYEYQNIDIHVEPAWNNWWNPLVPIGGQPVTIDDPSPVNVWAADYIRVHFLSNGFYLKSSFEGNGDSNFVIYAIYDDQLYSFPLSHSEWYGDLYIAIPEWTAAVDYIIVRTEPNGDGDYKLDVVEVEESEYSIGSGLQWLRTRQADDGDGSWQGNVGITSMAALAFLNQGYTVDDPTVNKAIQYILAHRNADGSFGWGTYETSTAVWALVATHNPDYNDEISDAKDWLVDAQYDEGEGAAPSDPCYGGWRYGSSPSDGDLSNTQFALMALDAAGLSKDSATWAKAITFTSRCQNRPDSNDQPWAHDTTRPSYNDGGFIYCPVGWSLAGGTKSYGSMTAAGIWSLRLCGVPVGNARVQGSLNWLKNNEDCSFDDNPGYPYDQGHCFLYYYYMTIAKALTMCFLDKLNAVDWHDALSTKLANLQHDDGRWVNAPAGHGWEDIPELATDYALLALQIKKPLPAELWMHLILASNADLHVYDPQGRHLGMNYQTGQMENEIPGATFTTDAQGRQIVELPELEAGHYRIELVGTSDGDYSLTVTGYRDQDVTSSETVTGTIGDGDTHVVDVVVSSLIGSLTIFVEDPQVVPSGLVAAPGDQSVALSWLPYQVSGFELAGYNVYRSITSGIGYEKINPSLVTTVNYPDTGLTNGATYYYVVTAVDNSQNETSHSREASATPSIQVVGPPQAPGGQGPPNDGVDHPRAVVNGLFEDVDGNGVFDIDDAILLARLYAGLEPGGQAYLTDNARFFDFNSDGVADIDDAIALSRIYAGLDIGPASVDSEIMVIPQGKYSTTGSFNGSQYSVLLKDASKGLKVYKIALSVDEGSISGVSLSNLVGIGLEISPDKTRATIAAVDFASELQPSQDDQAFELARVWVTGADRLHVEAEILQDDYGKPLSESWIYVEQAQPVALRIARLSVWPNPVTNRDTAYVAVEGEGIQSICLQVFDLSGRLVYDSGLVIGSTTAWHLVNQAGETLANGVYLYIVTVHGFDGTQEKLKTGKLAILR